MSNLAKAFNVKVYPEVKEIVEDEDIKVEKLGDFAKVKSKDIEYYFLFDNLKEIDSKPDKFVVRESAKHNCLFIVPENSSNGFKKF